MRTPARFIAAVSAILSLASAAGAEAIVDIDLGKVAGSEMGGVTIFKGIPFAAPPTGPLRWQPPQPAQHWQGLRDARAFGPVCPQPHRRGKPDLPQSEDCLTLNVATPTIGDSKLPVIVVIHGGAFFVGSGREMLDGGAPSIVRRGVVLVAPNYRLGRFGFFAHPALAREAKGAGTANFWLMDQIAALQWVRRNIARFGGDPNNVTVMGCSAGGSSVNALVTTPKARGLFAKASVHSGGGLFNATRPLALAEAQGMAFAQRVGVASSDAAGLARLRALPVDRILAGDPGPPNFGAVIDGTLIPDATALLYARGETARVPLIIGSTSNEASVFGLMGFDRPTLERRFGIDIAALAEAYAANGPIGEAELLRQVQTDFIFTSASMTLASLAARSGAPTWSYHFDYVDTAHRGREPGADHCADWPYLFDTARAGANPVVSPQDRIIAETLQDYLYNFVARGDPNGHDLPPWPRTEPGQIAPLVIGTEIKSAPGFRRQQLQPWFMRWELENGQSLGFANEAHAGPSKR